MDRFEVLPKFKKLENQLYLHSSMDRFEDTIAMTFYGITNNLHSSMDRFEEAQG